MVQRLDYSNMFLCFKTRERKGIKDLAFINILSKSV